MKYDPGKAFPHPVLRPDSSDYQGSEFEVDIDLTRVEGSTALQLTADFVMSDPDLLALIEAEQAEYLLVMKCSTTHQRIAYRTREPSISEHVSAGTVSGRVELAPFVVAIQSISEFRAEGWHSDWMAAAPIPLSPGAVLALDWPKEYYVDNAEEADIGSFLVARPSEQVDDGQWQCEVDGKRVEILMSPEDHRRFLALRANAPHSSETVAIWNGLYLPALAHAMYVADASDDALSEWGWYRSLERQLEDARLDPLGTSGADRMRDAQALLRQPFGRMVRLAEEAGT